MAPAANQFSRKLGVLKSKIKKVKNWMSTSRNTIPAPAPASSPLHSYESATLSAPAAPTSGTTSPYPFYRSSPHLQHLDDDHITKQLMVIDARLTYPHWQGIDAWIAADRATKAGRKVQEDDVEPFRALGLWVRHQEQCAEREYSGWYIAGPDDRLSLWRKVSNWVESLFGHRYQLVDEQ